MEIKSEQRAALRNVVEVSPSPLLSNQTLRHLYATMLKCRALEERASLLMKQWRLAPIAGSSAGQEAIKVGCAIDLLPEDRIASPHPDLTTHFIHGLPVQAAFSPLYAWRRGAGANPLARPKQDSLRSGISSARKMRQTGTAVVAFSTRHRSKLPHETLRRAAVESLPIVFVLDNRLHAGSGSTPRARTLPPKDYGFPGIPVDGDDVVAVYRVAHEAIARARRGDGPTLIECKTYCLDYPRKESAKKRGAEETSASRDEVGKDPIEYMEQFLRRRALFRSTWKNQVMRAFSRELDAATAAGPASFSRFIEDAS